MLIADTGKSDPEGKFISDVEKWNAESFTARNKVRDSETPSPAPETGALPGTERELDPRQPRLIYGRASK